MHDKFLRAPAVTVLTGLSRTSLWRYERDGGFPKRRQIGVNSVAWLESEVLAWMESRPVINGKATLAHGRDAPPSDFSRENKRLRQSREALRQTSAD